MKGFFTLILFVCGCNVCAGTEEFIGRVVTVIDGNTFEVIGPDKEIQRLVLAGIDSPDPGQPYAEKAKRLLEQLVLNKDVLVQLQGKNRLGNYLAVITLVKNQKDPRIELLEEGLAWTSEKNPMAELEQIRMKAVEKGRGIWQDENPTPPWLYRREQSMMQAKSS